VGFVGFTNDASGGNAAQFEFMNGFKRDIGFAAEIIEPGGVANAASPYR